MRRAPLIVGALLALAGTISIGGGGERADGTSRVAAPLATPSLPPVAKPTAMIQRTAPALTPAACGVGDSRYTEAQSIVPEAAVGEPIVAISANLTADVLEPCAGGDGGFAAAMINVAGYDRSVGVGGNLVQLGVVSGQWWNDGRPTFFRTEDSTGGVVEPLGAPYPQPGVVYTLTIERAGETWWRLTISDADGVELHHVVQRASWHAESAWMMFEMLRPGAVIDARFDGLTINGRATRAPACDVRDVWHDGQAWQIGPPLAAIRCDVDGGFSADPDNW